MAGMVRIIVASLVFSVVAVTYSLLLDVPLAQARLDMVVAIVLVGLTQDNPWRQDRREEQ